MAIHLFPGKLVFARPRRTRLPDLQRRVSVRWLQVYTNVSYPVVQPVVY